MLQQQNNPIRQYVATFFFVVATVILSLLSLLAALDRSGKSYFVLARLWSQSFCFLFGVKIKVVGTNNIKKDEHYVFVVNHSSYTDIPICLVAIAKDIRLILRHTLTQIPIWGWALYLSPMIIINRSSASKSKKTLDNAIKTIKNGASILLFPEGTRTKDGTLQSFKRGAFHLAYAGGASVVPIAIKGTFELMSRNDKLPKTNHTVVVTIGSPLKASKTITIDRENELDLMQRTEEAISNLLKTA